MKLIPFDRHFTPEEQDAGLKGLFRKRENMSGILNWLLDGYRMMLETGMTTPPRVTAAVDAYRQETDIIGAFLEETTLAEDGNRLQTSVLYACYMLWAKENGYRQMNSKNFVGELRRRLDVRRDGSDGNVVVGLALSYNPCPIPKGFAPTD